MKKIKILWQGESSWLNTGYGVYTKNLLSRLHATGKYEIAEFGIYGHWNDHQRWELPWKFYGNMPDKDNKEEFRRYNSYQLNQFGCWRINDVLLDFQPDIVVSISDYWMVEAIERSPFRNFYYWLNMPPVDSTPNYPQWVNTYLSADKLLGYTKFCQDYLSEFCDPKQFVGIAPPGADFSVFKPVENKKELRAQYGFEDDVFILGTVMRNMGRKLFPDLFKAFKIFTEKYPEIAKKTYLYCHTSHPDLGYQMPKLIRETGISHKVLFSYICTNQVCGHVFPSFFTGPLQTCPQCGKMSAYLPNSKIGITRQQLATVINWFDLYVQYSNSEAAGMPIIEAAACGVPVCAVDYSGMASIVKDVGGYPIPVQRFFTDTGSHAERALPDNGKFAEFLHEWFSSPDSDNPQKIHQLANEYYNWDKTAKVWEKCIDSLPLKNPKETWNSPSSQYREPNLEIPQRLSNDQFAKFIIANVWGRLDKVNSYTALRLSRDLNYNTTIEGTEGFYYNEMLVGGHFTYSKFTRDEAVKAMLKLNQHWGYWENKRLNTRQEEKPLYLRNA